MRYIRKRNLMLTMLLVPQEVIIVTTIIIPLGDNETEGLKPVQALTTRGWKGPGFGPRQAVSSAQVLILKLLGA